MLIAAEDEIRGLDLKDLDFVVIIGRPKGGPDSYVHIAGRTGRAGRHGSVVSIGDSNELSVLLSWKKMLKINHIDER